jgi:hypothetical protein
MYKVLTVVAVLAIAALCTSIITTVIEHSAATKQSDQIAKLAHTQQAERREISALRSEVRARKASADHAAARLSNVSHGPGPGVACSGTGRCVDWTVSRSGSHASR